MKYADQATPNQILRQERELRGWSQNYVAEQLEAPSPSYISRWERGTAFPSPYYREKLCRLFDKNARELGLLQASSIAPASVPMDEDTQVQDTLPLNKQEFILSERMQSQAQAAKIDFLSLSQYPLVPQNIPPPGYTENNTSQGAEAPRPLFQRSKKRRFSLRHFFSLGLAFTLLLVSISIATLFATRQIISPARNALSIHSALLTRSWPTLTFDLHVKYENVRTIQLSLRSHGFDIGKFGADGIFGAETEYAVRAFQEAHALPITGIVDQKTWGLLLIPSQVGARGSFVLALQRQLNLSLIHPRIKLDSNFSTSTEKAVRQFQQVKKLSITGKADLDTWCLLVGGSVK